MNIEIVQLVTADSAFNLNVPLCFIGCSFQTLNIIPYGKGRWNLLDNKYQSNDITMTCVKWLQTIEESVSGEPRMYVDRTLEILRKDSEVYQAYPHGEENGDEDNIEA